MQLLMSWNLSLAIYYLFFCLFSLVLVSFLRVGNLSIFSIPSFYICNIVYYIVLYSFLSDVLGITIYVYNLLLSTKQHCITASKM